MKNKEIFSRFVVAALVAYFVFKYNYEVTQLIYACRDFVVSVKDVISTSLERTFDDSGILFKIVLLIVYILWALLQIIVLVVGGLLVWLVVTLNDAYILPFIIPLFIVYSKFSYTFIVRPILWLPLKITNLLRRFGSFLLTLGSQFVVLPIAEVIALTGSPGKRAYKIGLSLLFVFGVCGTLVGGTGVIVKAVHDKNLISDVDSFLNDNFAGLLEKASYEYLQFQPTVLAITPNWTATAIQLRRGDVVSFTATGKVRCIAPFRPGMKITTPEGLYLFNGYVTPSRLTDPYHRAGFGPSNYILDDENINCLIGKVGIEEAFAIGTGTTYKVQQDGELFLGINQLWKDGAWKNNAGQFSVNLVIRRKV